ncbi:MAG: ComF family protein [Oscillospiraceae bacterium]|nr:ComF family protein [Oscillospiraceae bacterium]
MSLIDRILDLLYPRKCVFCHRLIEGDDPVCGNCRRKLPYTQGAAQKIQLTKRTDCFAPLYYEGDVRGSLLRYKFHGATAYAEVYGEFLSKCIDENGISCDSITWVPLSRKRLRTRGYDQARLLAEAVSARCGLPCERLLKKLRNTPAQSKTGAAAQRKANVSGVYAPADEESIRGKRILLVDDIVTTGATLTECVRTLEAAGAAGVVCLAVARKRD